MSVGGSYCDSTIHVGSKGGVGGGGGGGGEKGGLLL